MGSDNFIIFRDSVQKEESYNKLFYLSNQRATKQCPLNPEEKKAWQDQSGGSSLSSGTKQMFQPTKYMRTTLEQDPYYYEVVKY